MYNMFFLFQNQSINSKSSGFHQRKSSLNVSNVKPNQQEQRNHSVSGYGGMMNSLSRDPNQAFGGSQLALSTSGTSNIVDSRSPLGLGLGGSQTTLSNIGLSGPGLSGSNLGLTNVGLSSLAGFGYNTNSLSRGENKDMGYARNANSRNYSFSNEGSSYPQKVDSHMTGPPRVSCREQSISNSYSAPSTPAHNKRNSPGSDSDHSENCGNVRSELLMAADSVTAAMSSLVRDLHDDDNDRRHSLAADKVQGWLRNGHSDSVHR